MAKDVAVKEREALPAVKDESALDKYGMNAGFENQTIDDYSIPFIKIMQPTSPQIIDQVPGAKLGSFFNTVTGEFYDQFGFIPALTQSVFVEWVVRDEKNQLPAGTVGSGFVGIHKRGDPIVEAAIKASTEFGKYFTPNGTQLVDTSYVYGLGVNLKTNERFQCVMAFAKTHKDAYKKWISLARSQTRITASGEKVFRPLFSHVFRMTTVKKEANGNKWFVPVVTWAFNGSDDLPSAAASRLTDAGVEMEEAARIHEEVTKGVIKADLAQTDASTASAGGASDKDIPF